jgi:hypothetical protein
MSTVLHNGIIYQGEIGVTNKCVNSRLNGQRAKRVCEMAVDRNIITTVSFSNINCHSVIHHNTENQAVLEYFR